MKKQEDELKKNKPFINLIILVVEPITFFRIYDSH